MPEPVLTRLIFSVMRPEKRPEALPLPRVRVWVAALLLSRVPPPGPLGVAQPLVLLAVMGPGGPSLSALMARSWPLISMVALGGDDEVSFAGLAKMPPGAVGACQRGWRCRRSQELVLEPDELRPVPVWEREVDPEAGSTMEGEKEGVAVGAGEGEGAVAGAGGDDGCGVGEGEGADAGVIEGAAVGGEDEEAVGGGVWRSRRSGRCRRRGGGLAWVRWRRSRWGWAEPPLAMEAR